MPQQEPEDTTGVEVVNIAPPKSAQPSAPIAVPGEDDTIEESISVQGSPEND